MDAVALYSGGKDSTLALHIAWQQGFNIVELITVAPHSPESYMYHVPNVRWTALQAEAMGLPHRIVRAGDDVNDLLKILRDTGAEAVISGAVASDYQKTRIERAASQLGMLSYTPLWRKSQHAIIREVMEMGMDVLVVAVAAYGLGEDALGAKLADILGHLEGLERKYGINVAGEGGEYETFVLNAPMFRARVEVVRMRKLWHGDRGEVIIDEARVVR
jgi:ABC transporter with metal-binding/Fe-S-binding domain ATP-binding protein